MTDNKLIFKVATKEDGPELLSIYKYYVENSKVTFEIEPPTLEEFLSRMEVVQKKFPYFVAELNGEIVGFAYGNILRGRPAYDWSSEITIYLKNGFSGRGIGKKLLLHLENALKEMNIYNLYSCISCHTRDSELFHEKMGFKTVAKFTNCGFKDEWIDVIWMEKIISKHQTPPKEIIYFKG